MNAFALEVGDLEFAYGRVQVLFGVTFAVPRGEIFGLLGTNGAGKSTVLRLVAGLATPTTGLVVLDGRDVSRIPAEDRCRLGVSLVMGGRGVFPDLTVRENLELGGYALDRAMVGPRIERELERFPQLAARARQPAASLSGGEQQQLAIAKALLVDPAVLCIDELSLGLAPTMVAELFDVVRRVNASGVTCVLVEQSISIAAELCGHAVFLEKGEVRFDGAPGELLARGDLARAVFLGEGGNGRVRVGQER